MAQARPTGESLPQEEDIRKVAEAYLVTKASKNETFKRELIRNPKGVLSQELGLTMPSDFEVKVLEESPKSFYIVLPTPIFGKGAELSDELLEAVAGGKGGSSTPPVTGGSQSPGTKHTVTLSTNGEIVQDP